MHELVRRVLYARHPLGHGAVDPAFFCLLQNLLHAAGAHRFHEGLQDLLGNIAAGGQPIQKHDIQPLPACRDLPLGHIRARAKARAQLRDPPVLHPDPSHVQKFFHQFFHHFGKVYVFLPRRFAYPGSLW